MTSTSRSLQLPWSTPWAATPSPACSTLILTSSTVKYGATCNSAEEDATPTVPPLNKACLPWLADSTAPPSNAFHSPATACPPAWTAVATQTTGLEQSVDGETALSCCPNGFEDGGGGVCKPASTGTFAIVECGDADEEENESRTYSGARWPADATVSVPALQLRFQSSDLGSASATGTSTSTSTGTSSGTNKPTGTGANEGGAGGMSTGTKAAIGTVIPIALLAIALAAFLLWRRRRSRAIARQNEKPISEAKSRLEPSSDSEGFIGRPTMNSDARETPEWNTELAATEAQHRETAGLTADTAPSPASELGGMIRRPRKPVPAAELDGAPVAEMDVSRYMAFQPSRNKPQQYVAYHPSRDSPQQS